MARVAVRCASRRGGAGSGERFGRRKRYLARHGAGRDGHLSSFGKRGYAVGFSRVSRACATARPCCLPPIAAVKASRRGNRPSRRRVARAPAACGRRPCGARVRRPPNRRICWLKRMGWRCPLWSKAWNARRGLCASSAAQRRMRRRDESAAVTPKQTHGHEAQTGTPDRCSAPSSARYGRSAI